MFCIKLLVDVFIQTTIRLPYIESNNNDDVSRLSLTKLVLTTSKDTGHLSTALKHAMAAMRTTVARSLVSSVVRFQQNHSSLASQTDYTKLYGEFSILVLYFCYKFSNSCL